MRGSEGGWIDVKSLIENDGTFVSTGSLCLRFELNKKDMLMDIKKHMSLDYQTDVINDDEIESFFKQALNYLSLIPI